jgi:acetyl-CoA decarbonylase/synthase complex subunit delta
MERLYLAAMSQGDDKLQYPMINNIGNEVWKCKEAKEKVDDAPLLGDPERRGILMEAVAAVTYLMSGSNILLMRHPESIRMTRQFIDALSEGGSLQDSAAITKMLGDVKVDFAKLAPELDLTIEEEKKAAPAKKEEPAAKAEKAKETPKETPKAEAKPKKEEKPAAAAKSAADPEAEAKAKEENEAKAQADAEAKAKADAEAKAAAEAKANEEAEAKAAADAKAKEDAKKQAAADAAAQREEEEAALRAERQKAKASRGHTTEEPGDETVTPAAIQYTNQEKILQMLDRFHKRV